VDEAKREEVSSYAETVADAYATTVASQSDIAEDAVEVTCLYLSSDPSRTNLLDMSQTCGSGGSLLALDRQVNLLESAERTWKWLLGAAVSTDEIVVEFTLHPEALVAIGSDLVEKRANESGNADLTIDDVSAAARDALKEVTSGSLTIGDYVVEPVGEPVFELRTLPPTSEPTPTPPQSTETTLEPTIETEPICPPECKCSSSGGPSGLSVNEDGYCVASCSQEHNFGHVVKRFCGDGEHYMLGDYIDCSPCAANYQEVRRSGSDLFDPNATTSG
jgi:hypothetical protein